MTVNRNLDLGGSGFGTLTVGTGSTLNLSNLFTSGGSTSATISGTGARLDAANSISVGAGSLTATNGGLIEAATVTNAAALAVLGTTSSMTVTGTITNSGTVSLTGGQITAGTLDFNGLGSPTGHGTVAARILNDSITSDIVASGGTLNLGNAADTAGFLNVGDLVVGTLTVNVFDANTALLGDVSIAGGRLTVPNGGTLVAGDVLTGRGRIDGSLTNGGTISSVGGELQFSGLLAGTGTGCSGLRFRFLTGGGFTGAGTIDAEVHGDAGTTITPTGALTLGTLSSTGGIALQGSLAVESHAVTLRDADLATLGNVTMATGTLSMPNGGLLPAGKSISGKGLVQGDLTNTGSLVSSGDGLRFSGLLLGVGQGITGDKVTFLSGGGFRGSGAIGCELDSDAGSTVTATGNLSAGLANHFNGVVLDGTLEVGPHVVTLLDANGLNLGSRTEIDAGELVSAVALVLPSTRRVEGRGTVDAPSFENRGVVAPALGANAETGRFDFAGSWTQTATGRLEIDIAGTIPDDEHDQLDVAGTATLAGTLAIEFLPGFSASHGQQILVLVSNGLTGTFPTVTTSGLPFGFAALVSYTATDVLVEIVADTDGDGSPDATDCAPSNAGAFAVPGAVPDLRALDAQTFAWTSAEAGAGAATVHDVVRGDALALPVGGASEVCLAPGTPAATAVDPDEPLVGEAFYYLVRGRNACGEGSWGTDGAGTPRETAVCP